MSFNDDSFEIYSALIRVFSGMLFVFQGYDKLFKIGLKGCVEAFEVETQRLKLPKFILWGLITYTSTVEFLFGVFLTLGLFYNWALILLGVDLIFVAIAFGIAQPMWDMKHAFPRFILIIINMFLLTHYVKYSLDNVFNLISK
ncbi:MAG: DoxX family membrane protein [Bacteroidetes bacterium]|nr:DoxX family membrane protein [Bacteroidota bacterium]